MHPNDRDDTPPELAFDDDFVYDDPLWSHPCPDGNEQRLCEILGFRLKGADYLQLRVLLRISDNGVCHATIDEQPDRVNVRLLACLTDDAERREQARHDRHETDCPLNVWLDAPLGDRVVIDLDSGEELPLLIPHWDTDEPSDHQR